MVNKSRMKQQLVLHEGLRTTPYADTEGHWTIGVGYNIDARGWDFFEQTVGRKIAPPDGMTEKAHITESEALLVLDADIDRFWKAMLISFPDVIKLNEVRQRVCLDMAFNMGYAALGFHKVIEAIKKKDWSRAARELYNSKWSRQVGDGPGGKWDRCDRLAKMLLTGEDYTL